MDCFFLPGVLEVTASSQSDEDSSEESSIAGTESDSWTVKSGKDLWSPRMMLLYPTRRQSFAQPSNPETSSSSRKPCAKLPGSLMRPTRPLKSATADRVMMRTQCGTTAGNTLFNRQPPLRGPFLQLLLLQHQLTLSPGFGNQSLLLSYYPTHLSHYPICKYVHFGEGYR